MFYDKDNVQNNIRVTDLSKTRKISAPYWNRASVLQSPAYT